MLEIQEKFSTEGYEKIIESAGNSAIHITEAFDKGEIIGFIAYAYDEDKTLIYDYGDGGDLYLCDGLVRSVLFKSCIKGINTAVFKLSDEKLYENLIKLGFVQNDNKTLKNLNEFMDGCKKCKEKL